MDTPTYRFTAPPWSVAETSRLMELWDQGLTCKEIAAQIPGRNRNAVEGRARKLGLPRRFDREGRTPGRILSKAERRRQQESLERQERQTKASERRDSLRIALWRATLQPKNYEALVTDPLLRDFGVNEVTRELEVMEIEGLLLTTTDRKYGHGKGAK